MSGESIDHCLLLLEVLTGTGVTVGKGGGPRTFAASMLRRQTRHESALAVRLSPRALSPRHRRGRRRTSLPAMAGIALSKATSAATAARGLLTAFRPSSPSFV